MSRRLQGEHVFVTGGAKYIGAAVVEKCLTEGASVSFMDLDFGGGEAFRDRLPANRTMFVAGDVRCATDIERATAAGSAKLGPVTGLVNNAGCNSYADPVAMTEAQWDDDFSVDLKSAWLCARAVLPGMLATSKGSIVNIASVHADHTCPGMFPYAAAKFELVGLTRSLALEVGPCRSASMRCRPVTRRRRWSSNSSPSTTRPCLTRSSVCTPYAARRRRLRPPIAWRFCCQLRPVSSLAQTGVSMAISALDLRRACAHRDGSCWSTGRRQIRSNLPRLATSARVWPGWRRDL